MSLQGAFCPGPFYPDFFQSPLQGTALAQHALTANMLCLTTGPETTEWAGTSAATNTEKDPPPTKPFSQIKTFASKPDYLSSIPGTYVVGGKTQIPTDPPLGVCRGIRTPSDKN